ncbi:MAG: ATP-binding cassette domain-containing protein, partial [Erysipelotrichaceae bacterium]|nr:ATP-binding cassette domain-containing protein [Erysipelotrichaceae bacterium]
MSKVILQVDNLKQYFRIDRHTTTRAVDNVSFKVYEGEIFSVVGESGSGKSTLGRSLIRIYDANAGEVTFLGRKITGKLNGETMKFLRKNMQMIFQDPMASLNPRKKVLDTVAFGLDVAKEVKTKEERKQRVIQVLKSVG